MPDLRDLYQEVILDHYRRPRNFREIEGADHRADGYNPLCGDRVTIFVNMDGDKVTNISFQGSGCAISTASASLLTEACKGKTDNETQALFDRFHAVVTGKGDGNSNGPDLGKLEVLAGVKEFPVRVKCATLAWHTFRAAISNAIDAVTTE
ncbi:MAG: SUF system NifU family Fe-S cluster assembly protein [Planctomycetota bacterium]|nr:SUF system NifU family Fe-S cluster assembly protein [Planctomycetota bacterium]